MAKVEKVSIALPPEMVGAVRDAVASGEYASTSEVIRDALRDWTLKRKMAIVEFDRCAASFERGSRADRASTLISSLPAFAPNMLDRRKNNCRGSFFRPARKRISKGSGTILLATIRRGRSPSSMS